MTIHTFGSVCSGIEKTCGRCNTSKPLDEFHRQPSGAHGRHSWCKDCANAFYRSRRPKTYAPEAKRRWQLMTRYRLTPEQVEAMRQAQGCACAICRVPLGKFHIDHDHNTKAVRGLLCHGCNVKLGGWDDLTWRDAALAYLGIKA